MTKPSPKSSFESALAQLEEIVTALEAGDLPLEEAMKKFEEGMTLSRFCSGKLDETERKITLLMKNEDGGVTETPFD